MIGKSSIPTLSALAAMSLLCSACVATVRPVGPPPRMEVLYVDREPPPPRVEIISAAPGDDHVWVNGHWVWIANRRDYEWSPGHWQRVEPGEHWVAGHWVHEPHGWYFVEGRAEPVVYVARRPPAVREEIVVARPSPEHVWIKGYWTLRAGEYEWIAGRWARPEPGFHSWVDGHWEHERRGWFFVDGHWKA